MNRISVIIPLFNDEKHIARCLESVCGQTVSDGLEILIVDDGSTDDSVAVAREVLERHSMLAQANIIALEENKGVANARKVGALAAKGEYILYCDSDDWMELEMCELMLEVAESEDDDITICDYNIVDNDRVEVVKSCYNGGDFLQQLLLSTIPGSLWNKLIRASFLKRNGFKYPDHDFSEDHVYCVQLAVATSKIGYIPKPLYNYRRRSNSLVHSTNYGMEQKRYEDDMANIALEFEIIRQANLWEKYRSEIIVRKLKTKNGYRENRILWLNTFPELGMEIFQSSFVSWRSRIVYLLRLIGLK